jgi:hypothetical protein
MDADVLSLLEADLRFQAAEIDRIYQRVHARQEGFASNEERLESLAFQLHNLYCAYEDLFRMIAEAFENRIGNGAGWHMKLLRRMREDVPGVRPAFIAGDDYRALDELRAFRHMFRHAYAVSLSPQRLAIALEQALGLESQPPQWVDAFLSRCREWLAE